MDKVSQLETAILDQAKRLAAELRQRAEHSRDNILREAHDRLHLKEEREVLLANARADREYRRQVQASELKFQKEMDLLRWNLVQAVLGRLTERIHRLLDTREEYRRLLGEFLAAGAGQFEEEQLVVQLNSRDIAWLRPQWREFAAGLVQNKQLILSDEAIETQGGVLIRTEDNRIRLDNTFEGRRERLASRLHQVIFEHLLPKGTGKESIGAGL